MRLLRFSLLAAVLLSGCVVRETRPVSPPLSDAEAVQRGETWCSSHGWGCRPRRLGRHGDVVEVVFDARGHGAEGPLRLEFGSLHGVRYVSVLESICEQKSCPAVLDGYIPMQWDTHHLTAEGSILVAKKLMPELMRILGPAN